MAIKTRDLVEAPTRKRLFASARSDDLSRAPVQGKIATDEIHLANKSAPRCSMRNTAPWFTICSGVLLKSSKDLSVVNGRIIRPPSRSRSSQWSVNSGLSGAGVHVDDIRRIERNRGAHHLR